MNWIQSLVLVLHVLTAIAVIGFVLLQHGKGADMGAAFGSGSSGSVFGSAGSANFLSRTTAILATVFFATSVALTWFGARAHAPQGVMEGGVMERASAACEAVGGAAACSRGECGRCQSGGCECGRDTGRQRGAGASRACVGACIDGCSAGRGTRRWRSTQVNHADVVKLVDTLS